MGLSNYLPSSRISQSGVCTSTTRPASPYEGQMIYETDTNRVLVYDNSAWVMIADTDTPPASQLIKTQTIGTAVSSVEVTNVFSSEFDNYKITISGGTSSTTTWCSVQLGPSSVSGYNTSYYGAAVAARPGGTATEVTTGTNNSSSWINVFIAAPNGFMGNFELYVPNLAQRTTINSFFAEPNTGGSFGTFNGYHNSTNAFTGFSLIPSSGTLTGGTIRVYGYRN